MMNGVMKTVLVTGSGRGIGRAVAVALARGGYGVVLHGREDSAHLAATRESMEEGGGVVRQVVFDVGVREEVRGVLEADVAAHGMYYGVVLNAGVARDNAFPFMPGEDWDEVMATNLDGFFNVLKPLVEPMLLAKQGGRIVVMSSVAGLLGNRGQVNYSAAKAGLIGAARALGLELARKNITVNCVAPGFIETDMSGDVRRSRVLPLIPMRRVGGVDEVSGVVVFLMSGEASYITRQVIAVDGGLS